MLKKIFGDRAQSSFYAMPRSASQKLQFVTRLRRVMNLVV
jgi:hypothetical protein